MTHRKAWEQQMIYLMMIDAEEDKQKFAILLQTDEVHSILNSRAQRSYAMAKEQT